MTFKNANRYGIRTCCLGSARSGIGWRRVVPCEDASRLKED
jgi:hypothetical protein